MIKTIDRGKEYKGYINKAKDFLLGTEENNKQWLDAVRNGRQHFNSDGSLSTHAGGDTGLLGLNDFTDTALGVGGIGLFWGNVVRFGHNAAISAMKIPETFIKGFKPLTPEAIAKGLAEGNKQWINARITQTTFKPVDTYQGGYWYARGSQRYKDIGSISTTTEASASEYNKYRGKMNKFLLGGVVSGLLSSLLSQAMDPNTNKVNMVGSMSNLSAFFQGQYRFEVFIEKPSDTDLKAIDDFFESYGYNVSTFAVPKLDVRDSFTYVKTRDAVVSGQCPQEAINQLKYMLDNGCKFWKGSIG